MKCLVRILGNVVCDITYTEDDAEEETLQSVQSSTVS
jgi:hypothetical protein